MKTQQTDITSQVVALFRQLQQERQQHQARIEEIDRALAQVSGTAAVAPAKPAAQPAAAQPAAAGVARRGRGGNAMPLRVALAQVLAQGPKTKEELMAGVKKIGYRFVGTNPMNSLQAFLYGPGKKLFKRAEGKTFALPGGAAAPAPAAVKAAVPVKTAKRNISPASRRKMAEAARKMWADRRNAAKTPAPKPAKAKRPLSAEARKRISDAVKARWARQKAAQK